MANTVLPFRRASRTRPRPSWRALPSLLRQALVAWVDDRAPSLGAALSFYTLFSIAPLLLIVISVAGLVFGEAAARGAIASQLNGLLGTESAQAVQALLQGAQHHSASTWGAVLGAALLLVGATSVFAELQSALDRIWQVPPSTRRPGWVQFLRTRLLSFGLVLGVGFLLTVSLVISAALTAWGDWWAPLFRGWSTLALLANGVVGFVLTSALFAMIFKLMPSARIAWRDVLLGAATTALLFTLGKSLIGLYIGRSGVLSGFGAAGSLVGLLLWVYYSAQVFLVGAELTWVYAHRWGSLSWQPPRPRPPVVPAVSLMRVKATPR